MCGEIFNNHFTVNLLMSLPVKGFANQSRFDSITAMNIMCSFFRT